MTDANQAGNKSISPEQRDALESLAESDLPCDWIAESVLETVAEDSPQDDDGGGRQ